jgi:hypothetical protein
MRSRNVPEDENLFVQDLDHYREQVEECVHEDQPIPLLESVDWLAADVWRIASLDEVRDFFETLLAREKAESTSDSIATRLAALACLIAGRDETEYVRDDERQDVIRELTYTLNLFEVDEIADKRRWDWEFCSAYSCRQLARLKSLGEFAEQKHWLSKIERIAVIARACYGVAFQSGSHRPPDLRKYLFDGTIPGLGFGSADIKILDIARSEGDLEFVTEAANSFDSIGRQGRALTQQESSLFAACEFALQRFDSAGKRWLKLVPDLGKTQSGSMEAFFKSCSSGDPNSVEIAQCASEAFVRCQRPDIAIEALEKALAFFPRMSGVRRRLADLHWWRGDSKAAHRYLKEEKDTPGSQLGEDALASMALAWGEFQDPTWFHEHLCAIVEGPEFNEPRRLTIATLKLLWPDFVKLHKRSQDHWISGICYLISRAWT